MMAEQRILSIALEMIDVSATGRKLAIVAFEPPLWIGTMSPCLKESGQYEDEQNTCLSHLVIKPGEL